MKRFFQLRSRREQVLITLFVVMAAVTWLASAQGRVRERWRSWSSARATAAAQQLWLDRQAEIEARAAAAVQNLDPARTYDPTRLVTTVTALASKAGLQPTIDPPQTTRTPQFAFHTIKVTFRRANLTALLAFYDELSRQAPYLNLEQIAVNADRNNTGVLAATLQISSTQIAAPGGADAPR